MNAKQKAITRLQRECKPIKDENDFEYYATNNIVFAMEIAIKEAKKEMFDDIDQFVRKYDFWLTNSEVDIAYKELKKRHLSTFQKEKQHNYRKKKCESVMTGS